MKKNKKKNGSKKNRNITNTAPAVAPVEAETEAQATVVEVIDPPTKAEIQEPVEQATVVEIIEPDTTNTVIRIPEPVKAEKPDKPTDAPAAEAIPMPAPVAEEKQGEKPEPATMVSAREEDKQLSKESTKSSPEDMVVVRVLNGTYHIKSTLRTEDLVNIVEWPCESAEAALQLKKELEDTSANFETIYNGLRNKRMKWQDRKDRITAPFDKLKNPFKAKTKSA